MAKVVLKTSANLPRRVSAKRCCFRRRLRPCDKRDVQEERRKQLHGHAVGSALTGICFDPVCTEAQNQIAALAIGFPIFFALLILRVAWQKTEVSSRRVEVKKEEEEQEYQLDAQGDYVFGVSGFRLFRVPATTTSANGGTQFIKVEVGPVQSPKKAKTFFFEKSQSFRSSEIFSCSLEHPIGVTFERTRAGKVVIAEIAEGTDAYRQNQVARLNQGTKKAPKVGDVLRACSSINFFYSSQALFGIKPPERTVVMYGCDDKSYSEIFNALSRIQMQDGALTLVLEREKERESDEDQL